MPAHPVAEAEGHGPGSGGRHGTGQAAQDGVALDPHPGLPHRRIHRATFLAAGLYNIGWGLFSALRPQWLFEWAGMPLATHPEVFATLAMVVGLYGVLYLDVARDPTRGGLIAAVGLTGKLLGPAGWLYLAVTGQWPLASGILILTNDLIWWLPFGWYLVDLARWRRGPSA